MHVCVLCLKRFELRRMFNALVLMSCLSCPSSSSFLLRTIFLVLLFSQYARNVKFPLPIYKSKKGWTAYRLQLFKMFPVSSWTTSSVGKKPLNCCLGFFFLCFDFLNHTINHKGEIKAQMGSCEMKINGLFATGNRLLLYFCWIPSDDGGEGRG